MWTPSWLNAAARARSRPVPDAISSSAQQPPGTSGHVERASAWIYSGLWAVLTRLFLVPREPPHMPVGAHRVVRSFQLAPGWLRYVKLYFWIACLAIDIV